MPKKAKNEDDFDYEIEDGAEDESNQLIVESDGTELTEEDDNKEKVKLTTKPEVIVDEDENVIEDDIEQYGEKVNKRIAKMTAKLRESERREQAALDFAKGAKVKLDQVEARSKTVDGSYLTEFENRLSAEKGNLTSDLHSAIERGDVTKQAEIQGLLAKHAVDGERLAVAKKRNEMVQDPAQIQTPAQVQPATPIPASPKAQKWASENAWFGADEPMTLTAFSIHKRLIETGVDAESDDYYNAINAEMRSGFPHKFGELTPQTPKKLGSIVATSSRGTGVSSKKKVTLTKSQVAIANKLGVPLDQYAREVSRLNS